MFGILLDWMSTGDWFYAFRWMPSRFFKTKQNIDDPRSRATYEAHRALNPNSRDHMARMTAREYRKR